MKQAISNYQHNLCAEQCAVAAEQTVGTWVKLVDTLNTWAQRARTRRHLAQLSASDLDDVGISPTQAQREIHKPFWLE